MAILNLYSMACNFCSKRYKYRPIIYIYLYFLFRGHEKIISRVRNRNLFSVQCRIKYADCEIRLLEEERAKKRDDKRTREKYPFRTSSLAISLQTLFRGNMADTWNSFPFVPLMTALWIISSRCSCRFSIFRGRKRPRTRVCNRGENFDRFCPAWKQGNW